MKKKVLIFGPIGDVGGRDVEVNIIARALADQCHVRVFSSIYITEDSFALRGLKNVSFSSFQRELYFGNPLLRFFGYLKFLASRQSAKAYNFIKNRFSRAVFDLRRKELAVLQNEIANADIVVACVQLTTVYLPEAARLAHQNGVPFIVRTTGTIREIDEKYFGFLKEITHFVHHSQANAENLNRQLALPYSVIDQCALSEERLLPLAIDSHREPIFGFIGRFSQEKGLLPLAEFFATQTNLKLVLAGDGPQKEQLLPILQSSPNIDFIGQLQSDEISTFFKKIDCLIIPSLEESGPLVGLEAMAAGKLIVSTRVGAMMERLSGTANDFWFDIADTSSLESCIARINAMPHEERRAICSSVRSKYLADYTRESIGKQYLELVKHFVL